MKIPILYEDNHLLVVEKPVNVPVQEDRSKDLDLLTMLKQQIKVRDQKPGNVFLGLVHRLDRPVGGAIVFAKTSKAASRLSDSIRQGTLKRRYLTVVRGIPEKEKAELEHYLLKDKDENMVSVVSPSHKQAKKAVLDYELLAQDEAKRLSLLAVQLHTGRSHQIRVQLSSSGLPLFGDQKYGQDLNKPGQQIALWSHEIEIPHPTRDELVNVKSSPSDSYPWNLWPSLA